MISYMATLFGGEAWDKCLELGQAITYTQLSMQIPKKNLHKIIKINQDMDH
jgi:hypothetical protein